MLKRIFLKISIFFIILFFINGWAWSTHKNIALKVIESLPEELNFNLTLVKQGSIAPDKDFKDFKHHSYPYTLNKSLYWIKKTKYFYKINDMDNASYSFGVLTHYISDTYAAPHTVSKEDYNLHNKYENQVKNYIPIKECQKININLKEELESSRLNQNNWYLWLKTKNPEIPKKEIEQSLKVIYPIALQIFNTTCINKLEINTKIISLDLKKLIYLIIIFILIILIAHSIFLNNK